MHKKSAFLLHQLLFFTHSDLLQGGHSHRFTVKFSPTAPYEYPIDCDQPRTVLEALKSTEIYNKKMKKSIDENIVIQLGKADRKSVVATHFPCSCVSDDESLIISCESEKVEEAVDQHYKAIDSRDKYSVFYIDTVGGLHTRKKKLFRNNALKQFKFLCVYGEKGITVEEALKRDGRFIDDLSDFTLSDNDNPSQLTLCTRKVDNLDQKKFKISLPLNKGKQANDKKLKESQTASNNPQQKCDPMPVSDVVKQRGISVREKIGSNVDTDEIYEKLRQQFPDLKKLMESRFPDDSYQKALNLRKENFGKIQQAFSEVHRVRKLLKLGESVCKVIIENVCMGTGFVLFDNFILTNAHLFKGCVEGEQLNEGIDVFVLFNYEDPEPHTNYCYFQLAHSNIYCSEGELDYAILELNPEGQKSNQTQTRKIKVPPGLLKKCGPLPTNGEACIIGHPAGGLKKMDPTCIIEKEDRVKAIDDHLNPYKNTIFTLHSISQLIKDQGIENIIMGGQKAEKVVTYNTFMYHGSSGSPVFDNHCRVFGLHTAGFVYGFPNKESVIEYAQPLLTIFEHFVSKLKKRKDEELLKRIKEAAKGNPHLEKMFNHNPRANNTEPAKSDERSDPDEPANPDESMEAD